MVLYLLVMAGVSALASCVCIYNIVNFLQGQGVDINYLNLRWNLKKYLKIYKAKSIESFGKTGLVYYMYLVFSLNSFLLFIIAIFIKLSRGAR